MCNFSDDKEKKPLLDIYQIMNLTKRLDAIERSVEKFATMLETVTRGMLVSLFDFFMTEK